MSITQTLGRLLADGRGGGKERGEGLLPPSPTRILGLSAGLKAGSYGAAKQYLSHYKVSAERAACALNPRREGCLRPQPPNAQVLDGLQALLHSRGGPISARNTSPFPSPGPRGPNLGAQEGQRTLAVASSWLLGFSRARRSWLTPHAAQGHVPGVIWSDTSAAGMPIVVVVNGEAGGWSPFELARPPGGRPMAVQHIAAMAP